ncbi:plasmalemma vesicle associated protein b [Pygocentrus nattereri]|uniref:Plasmalemma vesicle associated protein b n=1 Tax=Pygocentrus nattereri TaxID=42514 RepID=A0A3B4D132_PYGNA|nr:plasmalemma vesicle associated protein b [Pygocentrus nattereri]
MYNNSYSRPKVTLEKKVTYKSKDKSCGYYWRIVFFFSSLIQSLIIISLVLFLVYGQPGKTPEEKRVEELENGYNKLSKENTELRKDKASLTSSLKTRTTEKETAEKKLTKLTAELDTAKSNCTRLHNALASCNANKPPPAPRITPIHMPSVSTSNAQIKHLQTSLDHQKALNGYLQSNFNQTVESLKLNLERVTKEKKAQETTMLQLRQQKEELTAELQLYRKKCKEEFISSLQGIQNVTTAFLAKIANLFPDTYTFLLTCEKQREQMDAIKSNCTSLSREVETKFQSYLNNVGEKVSTFQAQSSHHEVQNRRLTSDLQRCRQTHTEETERCKKLLLEAQETQDRVVEPLLQAQKLLMHEKQLLQSTCASKPSMPRPSGHDPPVVYGHQSRPGMSSPGGATGKR